MCAFHTGTASLTVDGCPNINAPGSFSTSNFFSHELQIGILRLLESILKKFVKQFYLTIQWP